MEIKIYKCLQICVMKQQLFFFYRLQILVLLLGNCIIQQIHLCLVFNFYIHIYDRSFSLLSFDMNGGRRVSSL